MRCRVGSLGIMSGSGAQRKVYDRGSGLPPADHSDLARILTFSDRLLAAFVLDEDKGKLLVSEGLFEALGIDETLANRAGVDVAVLVRKAVDPVDLDRLVRALDRQTEAEGAHETRYLVKIEGSPGRWIRLVIRRGEERRWESGLVEDVTEEITTRRRLEYERDHDILTGLMNRRAFDRRVGDILENRPTMFGAMLMIDLDNLKFLNDSYGHDWGDLYIREAASVLRRVFGNTGICAHVSGDEFLVFVDSSRDEESALSLFDSLKRGFRDAALETPDGSVLAVRASMGVAFYSEDAGSFDRLREYADFAMYEAKNGHKGELRRFNRADYDNQMMLLRTKDDLNRLFEEHLVDYHFQPIVDVRTGEVAGYEALMRLRMPSIPTPDCVIRLARSQSKLHLVERMTFFEALSEFSCFPERDGCLLFVNSVGAQCMNVADQDLLVKRFGDMFENLVVEFAEEDYSCDVTSAKERVFHGRGCRIAIDDFGSGAKGEAMLLDIHADFVKIDMGVVRGVDVIPENRDVVRLLIERAHERGVLTIAEGVETEGELTTLVGLGIDYLQGYLIGRPAPRLAGTAADVRQLIHDAYRARRDRRDRRPSP